MYSAINYFKYTKNLTIETSDYRSTIIFGIDNRQKEIEFKIIEKQRKY